jgi:hypothetical protein
MSNRRQTENVHDLGAMVIDMITDRYGRDYVQRWLTQQSIRVQSHGSFLDHPCSEFAGCAPPRRPGRHQGE